MSKFLITGTAGFIGFHLANALLKAGDEVVGLDNINDYYDVNLKYARLKETGIFREDVNWGEFAYSQKYPGYRFIRLNLEDQGYILKLFKRESFDYVIHLAAQAGVRYSIDNPNVYIQSNIVGFFNILEACRHHPVKHLLYASSSSVYGNNEKVPFSEDDNVDHPVSLYAATKKSNELLASTYNHLYGINATGLRFFTVYGPWGRPDMAIWKFVESMYKGESLHVFAKGRLKRDFTYIEDIVRGIQALLAKLDSSPPPKIMNIGNNEPITVNDLIVSLEETMELRASIIYFPMQPGDVEQTYANIEILKEYCGFKPSISLKEGLSHFTAWYCDYVKTSK